ncbi:MAG TPA: 50S ribosomal protein L11 methyltransferase [Nitriliruptoraceae bacterium]|nr:50S ribosomal protein L11 methyltransferase [Nitriliruptoraceae bacterium]
MAEPVETWRATVTGPPPEAAAISLWQAGADAVEVTATAAIGFFPVDGDDADPPPLAAADATVAWTRLPAEDHMAAWRAASVPVRAGRFDLVPAHHVDSHVTPTELHRIVIDAGMAFGSGHHDTTAGCLEQLDHVPVAGRRILDVGTGTGILAIAAAMAGADTVVGVDTDPQAIEVARRNADVNGVEVELALGSTEVVDGPFDGVLANLLTGLLVERASDLAALVGPGGWLVASGVGIPRTPVVVAALDDAGFTDIDVHHRGDWAVLTGARP